MKTSPAKSTPSSPEELTKKALLDRAGWTRKLIETMLGQPDRIKQLPFGRRAHYYQLARVMAVERTAAFSAQQTSIAARKAAGAKAVQTKRCILQEAIAAVQIRIRRMPIETLRDLAIAHYNHLPDSLNSSGYLASAQSDPSYLDRLMVNYLRHEHSAYDSMMMATFGRTGKQDAIDLIRDRIYEAIADAYPELDCECGRQQIARLRM